MRFSVTLSGAAGAAPEPPLATKVTKAATKTWTIQESRFVEPNKKRFTVQRSIASR
jgi:hypothetical protein